MGCNCGGSQQAANQSVRAEPGTSPIGALWEGPKKPPESKAAPFVANTNEK